MQIQTQQSQKSNNPYKINSAKTSTIIHEIDPSEKLNHLHQKFSEYGKNAKEWFHKCALLLPEIEKQQVWLKKGFGSIYEYAAKLACMSKGQVDDALYILRKIENKPALKKVVEEKGINSVRPIVTIATEEDQEFWAEKAMGMSHHTLATYVREFRNVEQHDEELQVRNVPKTKNATKTITMQLSEKLANRLEKLRDIQDWETIMNKLVDEFETNKKPPIKEKASRPIPSEIENYILKRSAGRCEFPNCYKKYEHLHHTNRFASDKTHDPDKIIALCSAHHDLAHKGLIKNEDIQPTTWKIQKYPDYTNLNWFIDQQIATHRR